VLQSPIGKLGEDGAGAALRDRAPAIGRELCRRVDHDEVVGIEVAADIVDAETDAGRLDRNVVKRFAAATDHNALAAVPASEVPKAFRERSDTEMDAHRHRRPAPAGRCIRGVHALNRRELGKTRWRSKRPA